MPHDIFFNFQRKLHRRTLLRGAGVALAVPWLNSMNRAFGGAATDDPPRRFVAITLGLGLHADNLNRPPFCRKGDLAKSKTIDALEHHFVERRVDREEGCVWQRASECNGVGPLGREGECGDRRAEDERQNRRKAEPWSICSLPRLSFLPSFASTQGLRSDCR